MILLMQEVSFSFILHMGEDSRSYMLCVFLCTQIFFPLIVCREIMPFDIAPIIKISETGHITADDAEAMPLRMLREAQNNQLIYFQ